MSYEHVCGALGKRNEAEYQRLCERVGAPAEPVFASATTILHARSELVAWTGDDTRGWFWGTPLQHAPIQSPGDAVAVSCSAGIFIDGTRASVYTDPSGVIPVFIYRGNGYVLFSSSVDALASSVDHQLHVDWAAWFEILSSRAVLGQRTPFEEISRLPPSALVTWRYGRLRFDEQAWPWAEEGAEAARSLENAADGIIDAVAGTVSQLSTEPAIVPLSGGWDSRFLASAAASMLETPHAVTVPTPGSDELAWARAVARELGLEHDVLGAVDWTVGFERVPPTVDYLTSMHDWLWPLSAWLDGRSGWCLMDSRAMYSSRGSLSQMTSTRVSTPLTALLHADLPHNPPPLSYWLTLSLP